MDKSKIRKIGAVTLVALGFLIFAAYSIHLILFKPLLPPWSVHKEGKYVAYKLELWGFLWSIPVIISLFLLAYLIHPSKFEKFSPIANALFIILAVGGFGATALLNTSAIINNFPPANYIPFLIFWSIAGTSSFWIMGILAVFVFKKDKFENMKKEYKLTIFTTLTVAIIVTIWFMMFTRARARVIIWFMMFCILR